MFTTRTKAFAIIALVMNAQAASLLAQSAAPAPPASPPPATTNPSPPPLTDAEIEQIVAPVALYPDSLLSQIFMASTYPLEVVQADRFAKAHPKLTGDLLTKELEKQPWDASTKSLVNFPTVLAMMSEKLDSTIRLGDAFLDDQTRVMKAVQRLRAKAQAEGNLKTNEQQIVNVAPAPPADAATPSTTQVITIEPANPQVIYVPTYNPTVVYGTWPYPAYPPYAYYPPGYVAGAGLVGFWPRRRRRASSLWGYAWGNCNWGGNDVDIDYNRNTNINNNIDRSKYQDRATQNRDQRQGNRDTRQTDRQGNRDTRQGNRGNSWQHDPSHRQGVAYRDNATNQRFGGADSRGAQSREAYRGRADAGRQQINNGAANQFRGQNAPSPGNRPAAGQGANRPSASQRPAAAQRPSTPQRGNSANRGSSGGFGGVGGGGNATRSASQRGSTSRGTTSRSGGASRGASRGGGGGARGGGGRGGGGRR